MIAPKLKKTLETPEVVWKISQTFFNKKGKAKY
jgi:hypothetical protein